MNEFLAMKVFLAMNAFLIMKTFLRTEMVYYAFRSIPSNITASNRTFNETYGTYA